MSKRDAPFSSELQDAVSNPRRTFVDHARKPASPIESPPPEINDSKDPKGQSLLPDEPIIDYFLSEARGVINDNPTSKIVAEIHTEIRGILRLHQEIYDGIELATDQIQDKRIDFLEAGPEVVVEDLFVEFALEFFHAKVLTVVLKPAFRFIGKETANITNKDLKAFFESLRQNQAAKDGILEFTTGAIKTTGKAINTVTNQKQAQTESTSVDPSALSTAGVQIKSRGQSYLHKIESFLGKLAADVDILYSISLTDRQLRPHCQRLIEDIHKSLQRTQGPAINVKEPVQLEFEKLIWAFLVADNFFIYPRGKLSEAKHRELINSGNPEVADRVIRSHAPLNTKPPSRLVNYLKSRFFPNGQGLKSKGEDPEDIFDELKKLKKDFLEDAKNSTKPEVPIINVIKISFTEDKPSAQDNGSATDSKAPPTRGNKG